MKIVNILMVLLSSLYLAVTYGARESEQNKKDNSRWFLLLIDSTDSDKYEIIDRLLKQGQNPNVTRGDHNNPTALMMAAIKEDGKVMKRLLQEPNINLLGKNFSDDTALMWAAHNNNDSAEALLEKAKEILSDDQLVDFVLSKTSQFRGFDGLMHGGETALNWAYKYHSQKAIDAIHNLMRSGRYVKKFIEAGEIPEFSDLMYYSKQQRIDLVNALEDIIEEQEIAARSEAISKNISNIPTVLADLISEYAKPKPIPAEQLAKIKSLLKRIKKYYRLYIPYE